MYATLKAFLLPPASLLLLLGLGMLASFAIARHRRLSALVVGLAFLGLWACSTPLVTSRLLTLLERHRPITPAATASAEAIVVLSAGIVYVDDASPALRPDALTLERLQEAVRLHRLTGLPIVVSGGPMPNGRIAATPMAAMLRDLYLIDEVWAETRSTNTLENAHETARLLAEKDLERILLVTHSWHLPRALLAFDQTALEVLPAPAIGTTVSPLSPAALIPKAEAMLESYYAFYEIFGLLWYRTLLMVSKEASVETSSVPPPVAERSAGRAAAAPSR
jgi:uncharacterized SAM-binding protein YcdF (DUF218 family)